MKRSYNILVSTWELRQSRWESASGPQVSAIGLVPFGGDGLWLAPTLTQQLSAAPRPRDAGQQTDPVELVASTAVPVPTLGTENVELHLPPTLGSAKSAATQLAMQEHSPMSPPPPHLCAKHVTFTESGHANTNATEIPLQLVDEDEDMSEGSYGVVPDSDDAEWDSHSATAVKPSSPLRRTLPNYLRSMLAGDSPRDRRRSASERPYCEIDLDGELPFVETESSGFVESNAVKFGVVPVTVFKEVTV